MNVPRKSDAPGMSTADTGSISGSDGAPLLKDSASLAISQYLEALEGETCIDLHEMVMSQVEEPLLRAVMVHTQGNQSKAAAMLGLNRGTLRTKLRKYRLVASPE